MDAVWKLLERLAMALGWLLEQLTTVDRIVFLTATIRRRIQTDLPDLA